MTHDESLKKNSTLFNTISLNMKFDLIVIIIIISKEKKNLCTVFRESKKWSGGIKIVERPFDYPFIVIQCSMKINICLNISFNADLHEIDMFSLGHHFFSLHHQRRRLLDLIQSTICSLFTSIVRKINTHLTTGERTKPSV